MKTESVVTARKARAQRTADSCIANAAPRAAASVRAILGRPVLQAGDNPEQDILQAKEAAGGGRETSREVTAGPPSGGPSLRSAGATRTAVADVLRPTQNRTGLPDRLKAGVEHFSGFAMDDVRVHYNSSKPAAVHALAYTQGTDIHVGPRQERHLPHEAWHVVQQKQGRVKPTLQMKGLAINDDVGLEREADAMGAQASQGREMMPAESPGTLMRHAWPQPIVQSRMQSPIQRHPGSDDLKDPHDATDHKEVHEQGLHDWLKANAVDEDKVTRTTSVQVPWGDLLKNQPDDAGYSLNGGSEDLTGYYTPVYKFGKPTQNVKGRITYHGVNNLGQNLGVSAIVTYDMTSKYKELFGDTLGKYAKGDYPYFTVKYAHGHPGVHRGHLLARCLGGLGERLNWVPLSSSSNVSSMWGKVEKEAYDWTSTRGNWLVLHITPSYQGSVGPIPSYISYYRVFLDISGQVKQHDIRIIQNDVKNDSFYLYQKNPWS